MNHSLWRPYTQMHTAPSPLLVKRTLGSELFLEDGRVLIDAISSWWTNCHGYNHPHIVEAICRQTQTMPHVMLGGLSHQPAQQLADRLLALLPPSLGHVFFSESGSVSIEVAMKMALQFWLNQNHPQKDKFIFFKHSYHGDTFAAMSVCDPEEGMHEPLSSVLIPHHFYPPPLHTFDPQHFETFIRQHHQHCAALILEPLVQGAGGMKFYAPETLQHIEHLCQQYDVLLIADEIFTGFGRLGQHLFAHEKAHITPDIICLSKALTGGTLPLAATIASKQIFNAFLSEDFDKALMHGPTYMGNPIACQAANASLDLFEGQQWVEKVQAIETHLFQALLPLTEYVGVNEVRVQGALGVIEFQSPITEHAQSIKDDFIDLGVFARPFGNIVYTCPNFEISTSHLTKITDAMVLIAEKWGQHHRLKAN